MTWTNPTQTNHRIDTNIRMKSNRNECRVANVELLVMELYNRTRTFVQCVAGFRLAAMVYAFVYSFIFFPVARKKEHLIR